MREVTTFLLRYTGMPRYLSTEHDCKRRMHPPLPAGDTGFVACRDIDQDRSGESRGMYAHSARLTKEHERTTHLSSCSLQLLLQEANSLLEVLHLLTRSPCSSILWTNAIGSCGRLNRVLMTGDLLISSLVLVVNFRMNLR